MGSKHICTLVSQAIVADGFDVRQCDHSALSVVAGWAGKYHRG